MADGPYTYYVDSAAGLDTNPGTQAQPWQTITKVNSSTAASQSVGFMRGRTFAGQLQPAADGISYGAYGTGANPIINGAGQTQCVLCLNHNNLTFANLRLTAGGTYGLASDTVTGLTITGLEIDTAASSGIILGNGTNTVAISNCLVHNNGTGGSGDRNGIGIGGGGAAPHDITISGCDIYSNYADNIRISMTSAFNQPSNVTVKNNTLRLSTSGSGLAADGCTNLTAQYNVITGNAAGQGIYAVPASLSGHTETVTGVIYHNTIVGNLFGILATNGGGGSFNLTVKNNLFSGNALSAGASAEMAITTPTTWVSDYNLVYHSAGGNYMYAGSYMTWATWLTTISPNDSHSKNGSNPLLNPDYTLQAGSPALGAGTFISGVSTTNPANIGAKDAAVVATPTASNPSGTYVGSVTVALASTTPGAKLCYRLDGVNPAATTPGTCDAGSTTYTVPVILASGATLTVLGTEAGYANSGILTQAYAIVTPASVTALPAFQSFTLAANAPVKVPGSGLGQTYSLRILNTGPGNLYISTGSSPGANATSMLVPAGDYAPIPIAAYDPVWISADQASGVSIAAFPRW